MAFSLLVSLRGHINKCNTGDYLKLSEWLIAGAGPDGPTSASEHKALWSGFAAAAARPASGAGSSGIQRDSARVGGKSDRHVECGKRERERKRERKKERVSTCMSERTSA